MSKELPPQYNPHEVENKIYRLWEESGFFNPDKLPKDKGQRIKDKRRINKTFCITVPPPNITGSLHMGHALNAVIQDILIRKRRMEGFKTLWLPGTDHAGIATQNVMEKNLKKEGISRHDLGREKFIASIWEWKEKYGDIILDQFKKLGSSMDWSRTRFTMDSEYQKAVETAFAHYFKKGWIYQGERTINWCPRCATSLSDLEIEYREEPAKLFYIRYGPLTLATARPETKLGDTALAVNPKDARYQKYISKEIEIQSVNPDIPQDAPPQLKTIHIKVIGDRAADPEFGTGVIKVTPAHDLTDFEIYQRHPEIPVRKVIGEDGRMSQEAGARYQGLKVKEAREKITEDLKTLGLLERIDDYKHNVAVCYRCETTLEPLLSKQWFLKMKELALHATKAVKSGEVKFHPKRWEKVFFDWQKNIRDWTISRQIWWGHKIPIGACVSCGTHMLSPEIKGNWFFVRHGETDWNKERRMQGQSGNRSLNETGRAQARSAGKVLAKENIDIIISSDLNRARETAEIIGEETGAEVFTDPGFRERSYGILEGRTHDELRSNGSFRGHYDKLNEFDFAPEGGESPRDVETRVLGSLLRHKSQHAHKNIVVVSHGAALTWLIKKLRNLSPDAETALQNASILNFVIAKKPCPKCGGDFLELEKDMLDTWFSSALWPFATLGWPEKTKDLKEFYPTAVLSTARDIINLWVSRMIFSGLEFTGKTPFKDVVIHATILTKDGKRMSKSLGTGVDPMDLIARYGADATRFGLMWQAMGGQDIHWSEEHVVAGKKFCNKIWNAARFVLLQDKGKKIKDKNNIIAAKTAADKKILAALGKTKKETNALIDKYEFGRALHALYDFFWHDFCDVYIEAGKKQMADPKNKKNTKEILFFILANSLKLLHPFLPFITEEIWSHLPRNDKRQKIKDKNLLIVSSWPN